MRKPILINYPIFVNDRYSIYFYYDELPMTYKNIGKLTILKRIVNTKLSNFDIYFLFRNYYNYNNREKFIKTLAKMDPESYMKITAIKFGLEV